MDHADAALCTEVLHPEHWTTDQLLMWAVECDLHPSLIRTLRRLQWDGATMDAAEQAELERLADAVSQPSRDTTAGSDNKPEEEEDPADPTTAIARLASEWRKLRRVTLHAAAAAVTFSDLDRAQMATEASLAEFQKRLNDAAQSSFEATAATIDRKPRSRTAPGVVGRVELSEHVVGGTGTDAVAEEASLGPEAHAAAAHLQAFLAGAVAAVGPLNGDGDTDSDASDGSGFGDEEHIGSPADGGTSAQLSNIDAVVALRAEGLTSFEANEHDDEFDTMLDEAVAQR